MRSVLVIRHHLEDDAGLVGEALVERGFELTTVLVDHEHAPPPANGFAAVVILGANFSTYDPEVRRSWFHYEITWIGQTIMTDTPIFGICFGAQALSEIFGGVVERAPEGEHGWITLEVADGASIPSGPWFEYHNDRCVLPEEAVVLATTNKAVQAFSFGRHLGVQFHPEIEEHQLSRWFDSSSANQRAHSEREAALLEETRQHTPAARGRVVELVDFFLANAGLAAP